MHILVLEVDGEDIGRKVLYISNDKTVLLLVPANYRPKIIVLNSSSGTSSI